jgi:predicted enzyme related to lactoylglutathione lyase
MEMADLHGDFAWYELMTTDQAGAAAFYRAVSGWEALAAPMAPPGMTYHLFGLPGQMPAAGLMDLPEAAQARGAPPHWHGYVNVPDVDAALVKAVSLGARVAVPATDVPNVVRLACIWDPQGAAIGLLSPINPPPEAKPDYASPGRIGWHELYTTDWQASFGFYSAMFGWQKDHALDMGPMGTYQIFSSNGRQIGGMMNKPAAMPVPAWAYYVNVPGIEAALAAITGGGGQVIHGPVEVPGGQWIVQGIDPQGAFFAIVGLKG